MRKNITSVALLLSLCLATMFAPAAMAQQGKGQAKKETSEEAESKKEKVTERHRQHRPERIKDIVEKHKAKAGEAQSADKKSKDHNAEKAAHEGKGHAYGKNKGELSGREFGQARAASAKLTSKQKREELGKAVTEGDDKVTEAKGRLSRAVEELERKRKAGTITDAEYNEKQATISRTEKAIQVLEEKVNAAKVLVSVPVVE